MLSLKAQNSLTYFNYDNIWRLTMAFMIRTMSEEEIDKLKKFTGEKTASKALINAASQAIGLKEESRKRKQDCLEMMEEIKRMQKVIDSLLPLCVQVQEISGQSDLLNSRIDNLVSEYSVQRTYHW